MFGSHYVIPTVLPIEERINACFFFEFAVDPRKFVSIRYTILHFAQLIDVFTICFNAKGKLHIFHVKVICLMNISKARHGGAFLWCEEYAF